MITWVLFFRGINVGGNHILPMKELTLTLEKNGCTDITTYIQSGNVILRSAEKNSRALEDRIGEAIKKQYGFPSRVLAISIAELKKAIAENPFKQAEVEPKSLHLYFLAELPVSPDYAALTRIKTASESFLLKNKVLYLHTPDGIGRSKLAAQAERFIGTASTARNWNTVTKMADLAKIYV